MEHSQQTLPLATRRDPRYVLRRGSSFLEFADPGTEGSAHVLASVTRLSVAGLTFEIDAEGLEFVSGLVLEQTRLRIGECVLGGDVVVRNSKSLNEERVEIGGLFYPSSREAEDRLMSVIAGIEAAQSD